MPVLNNHNRIPEHEMRVSFSRSSGAGGQNVNKTSTKVVVHWPIGKSRVFTWEEKQRIFLKLTNRINFNGELVVSSEEERSQPQNRAKAVARLRALVVQALRVPKKRRPTKPTKISKIRRLETKKKHSQAKSSRRKSNFWF